MNVMHRLLIRRIALITGLLVTGQATASSAYTNRLPNSSSLAAGWNQAGFDARHSSYNPYETLINEGNVSQLSVVWKATIGAGATLRAVSGGRVYLTTGNRLVTLRTGDGLPAWTKSFQGNVASMAIRDGRVYVASNHGTGSQRVGTLTALRANDGMLLWTKLRPGAEFRYLLTSRDALYTAVTTLTESPGYTCRATVSARNPVTGKPVWSRFGPPPVPADSPFFCYAAGPLSERDGVIYARFPCTERSCLSPLKAFTANNGAPLWRKDDAKFDAVPVVGNGAVYLGGNWSYVASVSQYGAKDGAAGWSWSAPDTFAGASQPALAPGKLFFSWDGDSGIAELKAVSSRTGADAWSQAGYFGKPTVANGLVFVAGQGLAAFKLADGTPAWTHPSPDDGDFAASEVIVVNGRLYATTSSGNVYAFGLSP
jgi:hypothetical protein